MVFDAVVGPVFFTLAEEAAVDGLFLTEAGYFAVAVVDGVCPVSL